MSQLRLPAVFMRGGTSKGVFFLASDLPDEPAARDRLLLRVIGSPDPYGKQIDGMGGGTSSTSKVVILSRSTRQDCDVDYLFGAVSVQSPVIDWSGNCGNLSAAVGPFAISAGLVDAPSEGLAVVRIWQANIGKRIIARVPMRAGAVQEEGDFELDGVTFPAAEVQLEFIDPADAESSPGVGGLFPTGRTVDVLQLPGRPPVEATCIQAGNPTIFVAAAALGLQGTELQADVNARADLLALAEEVRGRAAVMMGLVGSATEAARRPHTPKLAFVAAPVSYVAASGKPVEKDSIDLLARIFSMGQLHHAMTGTGAVAIAAAAAVPGTVVNRIAPLGMNGQIRFGHPSGTLSVGVEAVCQDDRWEISKVVLSRSARRLMEGWVRVPGG